MKLDLDKCPIAQLKGMINQINRSFLKQKERDNLSKFLQLELKHIGKGKYSLSAEQFDSKTHKAIKVKVLKEANRFDLTSYVFGTFYTSAKGGK